MRHEETIRTVLGRHGRLSVDATGIGRGDDLYAVGLTSHGTVNVLLALEDELDVEFPDALMRRETFRSIDSLSEAVTSLTND